MIARNKTFYRTCSHSKHDQHRLRAVSPFFYCSQFTTDNDHLRVNTQKPLVLPRQGQWSQRTGQSPARDSNNERRIINKYQKVQRTVSTKTSALTKHLEVHSRRYTFLWKRRSCECRHCRCLARIVIALNRRLVVRKIQYAKPPKHLCLLNELLQTVGSSFVS